MAPGTNKKMKSCRGERFGVRHRKGCSKPVVDFRIPGTKERIWRSMDNDESAKRFVKLAYLYFDEEEAFPPDHPDLPHLKAFRKNELEVFIWKEFQRREATESLQDSEDGIDHGNRVGPIMATCAPESSCGHIEVEPNSQNSGLPQEFGLGGGSRAGVICSEDSPQAGDAQLNSRGLRPEQIYAMFQHMWREVERKEQEVEREKRDVEHEKQQLVDAWCAFLQEQRGAREGFVAMFENDEPDASLAPNLGDCGPSHATGFAAMFGNDELHASLAPNPFEGSIASLGCDDFPALLDTSQYVEDISELFLLSSPHA